MKQLIELSGQHLSARALTGGWTSRGTPCGRRRGRSALAIQVWSHRQHSRRSGHNHSVSRSVTSSWDGGMVGTVLAGVPDGDAFTARLLVLSPPALSSPRLRRSIRFFPLEDGCVEKETPDQDQRRAEEWPGRDRERHQR